MNLLRELREEAAMKVNGKIFAKAGEDEKKIEKKNEVAVTQEKGGSGKEVSLTYHKDRRKCNAWETDLEYLKGCPKVEEFTDEDVEITHDAYMKLTMAFKYFDAKSTEFGAYLIGERGEDEELGNRIIDVYCPEQEVGVVSVDFTNKEEVFNTIGVVHSHPGNSKSFSSHDDEFFNANNNLSLLISGAGLKATRKIELPCGSYSRIEIDVKIIYPDDLTVWLADSITRVKEKSEYIYHSGYHSSLPYCSDCRSFHVVTYKCKASHPKRAWENDDKDEMYGEDSSMFCG